MNPKVYPILIVAAFIVLTIVPFAIQAQSQHHTLKNSEFLGRAANAREVIRQLEATDE
ncbi:MAG: hypothetical protein K2X29_13705 [Candidatus Obscuribacterales bacterium]|nr:hypothetical protein [Candidatus Obscuribacterales bacterium]